MSHKKPTAQDAYAQICASTIHTYGRQLNPQDRAMLINALFIFAEPEDYTYIFQSMMVHMHSKSIENLLDLVMLSIDHNRDVEEIM